MGHLVGKDLYRKLGKKIDNLTVRVALNEKLYAILKELYTEEEARLVVSMPYGMSTLPQIQKCTGIEKTKLKNMLDTLSDKGLLLDISIKNKYMYMISPMMIGVFEFTMMRTRGDLNVKEWARLFHDYLEDKEFYAKNFKGSHPTSFLRAMPYEETVKDSEHVEILDYEKASEIIDRTKKFAVGICSCRHEKHHLGEKTCDVPLEKCSTLGNDIDYMVRHGFAREVSKSEMMDNLAESKDMGLIICADNVKKNVGFMCHCCGCCCNALMGISKFGYPEVVVTSNYIASNDTDSCAECGECAEACPINAISLNDTNQPIIDEKFCLGCGVCGLQCSTESMKLVPRKQRVLHPENTFERIIMQSLEIGNLQNFMFSEPDKLNHKFMRGFIGGFLRLPPVKKALLSDTLQSRFLNFMTNGQHRH